jgi:hypothetical protein
LTQRVIGEIAAVPINVGRNTLIGLDNFGSAIMGLVTGKNTEEVQMEYGVTNKSIFGHGLKKE